MSLETADIAAAIGERLGPGYAAEPVLTCLSDSPDGRRVTELRYAPKDRRRTPVRVIAKQFECDTGAATFAAMKALENAASARAQDAPLALPRALFYAPRLRTLGLEPAPGRSYRELTGHAAFAQHLRLAGGALAALHALDVPDLRRTRVDDHMAELMRPTPQALAEALPEHAALATNVVARLRAGERRFRAAGAIADVPVHRDFHLGQLFHDGDRVAVIDWDLIARGDPALDLGNFVAYLRTRVPHAAPRGIEAFLGGYAERAGDAALARVRFYEALTYLRLACKRLRLRPDGFRDDVGRMLRLARERLV